MGQSDQPFRGVPLMHHVPVIAAIDIASISRQSLGAAPLQGLIEKSSSTGVGGSRLLS